MKKTNPTGSVRQSGHSSVIRAWQIIRSKFSGGLDPSGIVWLVVIAAFALSGFFSANFPSWSLVNSTIILGLFLAIVSWGQGMVILTGGIDLSVGAAVTVGAYFTGYLAVRGLPTVFAILIGVGLASVIGVINGIIVGRFKFPAFIVTLATSTIAASLLLGVSHGSPGQPSPRVLVDLFNGSFSLIGIPTPAIMLILVILVGFWMQSRTTIGRRAYAIGNSTKASQMVGIKIERNLIFIYWLASIAYGIAGVLLLGYSAGSNLNIGEPWLLPSIAAVVVGGASISGGTGNYLGTVGAAMLITILSIDISAAGFPEGIKQALYGAVIVVALLLLRLGGRENSEWLYTSTTSEFIFARRK